MAQGIEVEDTTVPGILNALGDSTDFILVSNSTVTTDGIVNDGEIGDVSPNATGILVTNDSNVTGGITNTGNLFAVNTAIRISGGSTVTGEIDNSGLVQVGSDVAGSDVSEAYGFRQSSTNIDASISNSGMFDIVASVTSGSGLGSATANAYGVELRAFTNLDATVNNSGTFSVTGTATNAQDAEARAYGIWIELAQSEAPPPANAISSVTNSSSSTIDVSAVADADGLFSNADANAIAGGIFQFSEAEQTTDFSASNSGMILVESSATAFAGSADAFAFASSFGIHQQADGQAIGSALLSANNGGMIEVSAVASARTSEFGFPVDANAQAVGIAQDALLIASTTANVSNSGEISVLAEATGEGPDGGPDVEAMAQGIRQEARGGETSGLTANLSIAQTGTVDVQAIATGDGEGNGDVDANAQGIFQEAVGVDSATTSVVNGGDISVSANVDAEFDAPFSSHQPFSAKAAGISQEGFTFVGPLNQTVTSSGNISVTATAGLDGTLDSDDVDAEAFGIRQLASGNGQVNATANVSGDIDVTAMSRADGFSNVQGNAFSRAAGIDQRGESYTGAIQSCSSCPRKACFSAPWTMMPSSRSSSTRSPTATPTSPRSPMPWRVPGLRRWPSAPASRNPRSATPRQAPRRPTTEP